MRETTHQLRFLSVGKLISTHVPRAGDDAQDSDLKYSNKLISTHVPRAGDDRDTLDRSFDTGQISTHVPRAGDDPPAPRVY